MDQKEPTIYRQRFYRLNEQKLAAAFEERGVTHQCPFCASTKWVLLGSDRFPVLVVPWGSGDAHSYLEGADVIAFVCSHCGFLRQHAASMYPGVLEEVTHG